MSFSPEVEARFKLIEDAHAVTAELLHRVERKCEERFDLVEEWAQKTQNGINALIEI